MIVTMATTNNTYDSPLAFTVVSSTTISDPSSSSASSSVVSSSSSSSSSSNFSSSSTSSTVNFDKILPVINKIQSFQCGVEHLPTVLLQLIMHFCDGSSILSFA